MKVGIIVLATGKYIPFVAPLQESIVRFFRPGEVTTFVLTDSAEHLSVGTEQIIVPHHPWPHATLLRYHKLLANADRFREMEYLFQVDADMRFVAPVGKEVIGGLVATIHPGFWNKSEPEMTFERNPDSAAYVQTGRKYYMGAFTGGERERYLCMARDIADAIDADASRGIVGVWQDESYLNAYLHKHPPTLELSPSYCYPETWDLPFEKKVLALDKDHAAMRAA